MANYSPPRSEGPPPIPARPNSTMAIVSLVTGILAWVGILPLIGAIVAVITGHLAKNEIRGSMGELAGEGMATAGLVLGYIQLAIALLCLCGFLILMALGVTLPIIGNTY
jgi:hypothetical protein